MLKTFIWSKNFPKYDERLEAMSFADEILTHEVCEKLELVKIEPMVEKPTMRASEGLKPFRHGSVTKWN